MKLLSQKESSQNKDGAVLQVQPEDKEDLFTIYQLVDADDELIFKKLFTSTIDVDKKKKSTNLVKLRIKVLSNEFDMRDEFLRYKGVTVEDDTGRANVNIPAGKFISYTITYAFPITIIKQNFDSYARKILKEACNPEAKADTAAVVLQEGVAHVCVLTASSTILKQKIEYSLPKKKTSTDVMKFDEKTEKFYKAIYEAMKKNFDFGKLRMILLCSPGFYARTLLEKVTAYAGEENNSDILGRSDMFLVAHCSTGYLQGITEVLKDPVYSSQFNDTKYSREAHIMDEFMMHLNDDDFKAWYGEAEVMKAADLGAIQYLLITDLVARSPDLTQRKKYLTLMNSVERNGGKAIVFSSLHITGEELDNLTGLACILKYPLPDLDEGFEDEGDSDE
ncbi:ribosome dissociation factor DOM34 KNAG_0H01760 [Huiozyma naganishii CBS 8797]|uniref:Protein DOM34 homolog n=1 Tax=Huiozyma naganishii (strain ATCC MYA-139 / BCRC 22969 / CBS 8797 / KCTC 17520 / NBRC 10181 / NCYC 3082 / Yp74L-3) TaxID=1071383 RepID=J7S9M7_HUIN7|nr:hypothetical protein KNAG_0H01760 [Kazachstania naganishii CBS 8797]CCK71591.1 hypothetical protein KNAG_0H01760 [Kazachstania naganishii CBS 8797]